MKIVSKQLIAAQMRKNPCNCEHATGDTMMPIGIYGLDLENPYQKNKKRHILLYGECSNCNGALIKEMEIPIIGMLSFGSGLVHSAWKTTSHLCLSESRAWDIVKHFLPKDFHLLIEVVQSKIENRYRHAIVS